ncbi:single-stranded-DNA-specific exonuclease RecJ [Acidobacteriota bacterium]
MMKSEPVITSIKNMRWRYEPPEPDKVQALAESTALSPITAGILLQRGVATPEQARAFLSPAHCELNSPWLLKDMDRAVERLSRALDKGERIMIHGDYDSDGITGTVMLVTMLRRLGATVDYHIPDRFAEGYGVSIEGIRKAEAAGCSLMVTVDCGISAADAVGYARKQGIDVIVTDHHNPDPEKFPNEVPVVNPKQDGCAYPDKRIAGVTVGMKLIQALLERRDQEIPLESLLKLACIGTIADVVPLVGENRVIAALGLAGLKDPRNTGLKALLQVSGVKLHRLSSGQVGFQISPRLNAAGRMEHAGLAVELFLNNDPVKAAETARHLNKLNRRRQEKQDSLVDSALAMIEASFDPAEERFLVLAGQGWHRGVLGIGASKIREVFHVPVILISIENGVGHGSGRSIPGFDLFAALTAHQDLLIEYGGHEQACGLRIDAGKIDRFREQMKGQAASRLSPEMMQPSLAVDGWVTPADLTGKLVEELGKLAPFGQGNPAPILATRGLALKGQPKIMKDHHLTLQLIPKAGQPIFRGVMWRSREHLPAIKKLQQPLSVAFKPKLSTYSGEPKVELEVIDIAESKP